MSESTLQKIKITFKFLFGLLIILLICACIYGYYYIKRTYKVVKVMEGYIVNESNEEGQVSQLTQAVKFEEVKINEIEKQLTEIKSTKPLNSNDYTALLLALNVLEKKLENGGNIANDLIKLKTFSTKVPEISIIISKFEDVKIIPSKEALNNSFNDYIKDVKAHRIEGDGSKVSKFIAKLSKIFTILNASNPEDALLIQMKNQIKEGDFVSAFETSKQIDINTTKTANFLKDLENTSKIQTGINQIHLFILESLNK